MKNDFFVNRFDNRTIVVEADYYNEEIKVDFYAQKSIIGEVSHDQAKATQGISDVSAFLSAILDLVEKARESFYDKNCSFDAVKFICADRAEKRVKVYNKLLLRAFKARNYFYSSSIFVEESDISGFFFCYFQVWKKNI